jgi:hypothetical protein
VTKVEVVPAEVTVSVCWFGGAVVATSVATAVAAEVAVLAKVVIPTAMLLSQCILYLLFHR